MPTVFPYVAAPLTLLFGYLAKRYFSGGVYESSKRLDDKIVIITGANTGIGYETALNLANRGARIILACRDLNKAQLAADNIIKVTNNSKVEIEHLDTSSLKSVKEFSQRIKKKIDRLDILINNAGLGYGINFSKTQDGFETIFATNHLGHFYLTNLLIDLLKTSSPSRVINVSSRAHERAKMNWNDLNMENNYKSIKAYEQSKLANVLFTKELAKRYGNCGITSVSLHPGVVRTEIFRHFVSKYLVAMMYPFIWLFLKDCKQGAQTTIYCAVNDDIVNHNGSYFSDCKVKTSSNESRDFESAEKLWKISSDFVKLD